MNIHEKYIKRCIQLAKNGVGTTYPNPLVGSVIVYNNKDSNYQKNVWNGVTIKHVFSNEKLFRSFNVFITDFLSLLNAVRSNCDIILALGSAPNPLFYHLISYS